MVFTREKKQYLFVVSNIIHKVKQGEKEVNNHWDETLVLRGRHIGVLRFLSKYAYSLARYWYLLLHTWEG